MQYLSGILIVITTAAATVTGVSFSKQKDNGAFGLKMAEVAQSVLAAGTGEKDDEGKPPRSKSEMVDPNRPALTLNDLQLPTSEELSTVCQPPLIYSILRGKCDTAANLDADMKAISAQIPGMKQ